MLPCHIPVERPRPVATPVGRWSLIHGPFPGARGQPWPWGPFATDSAANLFVNALGPCPGPAHDRWLAAWSERSPAGHRTDDGRRARRARAANVQLTTAIMGFLRSPRGNITAGIWPRKAQRPPHVSAGGRCSKPGERLGGQGRGRTADLPIFSRTLVPTELPGRTSGAPLVSDPDGTRTRDLRRDRAAR